MPILEEAIKTRPIKDPYTRAFLNVMYTGTWMLANITQALKPYDISEPQFNVLRILRGQQGNAMPLFQIQDRMIQKMSNVSRLVDKLLEKQLVERSECPSNRRKVDIRITKKGLDLLEKVEPAMQKVYDEMSKNLKKDEAKVLAELLDTLRKDL
jgi:DNA-binding MarR family transcriptional regulator